MNDLEVIRRAGGGQDKPAQKADCPFPIKAIDNGVGYARKFAGYYNGIAQWCGLPTVPTPFAK